MINKFNFTVNMSISEALLLIKTKFKFDVEILDENEVSSDENNKIVQFTFKEDFGFNENSIATNLLLLEKDSKTTIHGLSLSHRDFFNNKKLLKIEKIIKELLTGIVEEEMNDEITFQNVIIKAKDKVMDAIFNEHKPEDESSVKPEVENSNTFMEKINTEADKRKRKRDLKKRGL